MYAFYFWPITAVRIAVIIVVTMCAYLWTLRILGCRIRYATDAMTCSKITPKNLVRKNNALLKNSDLEKIAPPENSTPAKDAILENLDRRKLALSENLARSNDPRCFY